MGSATCALEDSLPDGTPKHFHTYLHLRNMLQEEVFHLGFQLPCCYPPEGGYNWTPPITDHTASVGILSILGEDDLEAEELHI